jgi:hypothetical protein
MGHWQTVFQNPAWRELLSSMMFSMNENESLVRTSVRAMTNHPQSGAFRQWWFGFIVSTAAIANVINLAATGEPLPKRAYNPMAWQVSWTPFGVGYNTGFLSPQIPFVKGRNGTPLYVDLVGQMDTLARWTTHPYQALAGRLNVPQRALLNQMNSRTFMGDKLDSPVERLVQLGLDLGMPITAMNAVDILRENVPEGMKQEIPPQEPRLGTQGQLLQMTGINIRSQNNAQLMNPYAQRMFRKNYYDLEPSERRAVLDSLPPNLREEMRQRGKETEPKEKTRPHGGLFD